MKRALALAVAVSWLCACADEAGIVACVDVAAFEDGDEVELDVTFASSDQGPTCSVLRRTASPLPFCVAATRGERYGYAMAVEAIWRRADEELGRRALVVPYADEGVVDAALDVGDCCGPSDAEHQCLEGACAPIPASTRDFFVTFEEDEECEE